jgi:DNA primase
MDEVEEIRSRVDIVDVIGQYVDLKRAGRTYKALCPFHSEKTPSFVVFPDTQSWRCFGACGEGGDVFSFLMKKNGWDFVDALKTLAARTGVELRPRSPAQQKHQEAHARLYDVLDAATLYYERLLARAPEAEPARDYLVQRGLLPHTIEQFQLGYSADHWDGLRTYLHGRGYTDQEMVDGGLLAEKEGSGRPYDRFRGRLMIPIRDLRGRVVGFGARTLVPDGVPKYLNSPQSDLFDKSALLFGLDQAKKGIREAGEAVIVEGYLDVIQAHQAGFTNLVAQMGTALTETQLRQLKRYTNRFVLALDADLAGQKATLRGLDVARQTLDRDVEISFDPRGLLRFEARLSADIRVVTMPEGYDPDKLIKSNPDSWTQLLERARPVVEHIIESFVATVNPDDAKEKVEAVNRVWPIIQDLRNPVERDHYTQYLARRLRADERAVASMVRQRVAQTQVRSPSRAAVPAPPAVDEGASPEEAGSPPSLPVPRPQPQPMPREELFCLYEIMHLPSAWKQADNSLLELSLPPISCQDFADPQNRALFASLQQTCPEGAVPQDIVDRLEQDVDPALRPRLDAIRTLAMPGGRVPTDKAASHLAYLVLRLRKSAADRAKRELDSAWAVDLSQNHKKGIGAYSQQVLELRERRLRIDRALSLINSPTAGLREQK